MRTHFLKTWPEYFLPLKTQNKTFELRLNDRDFQIGDTLVLQEFNPHNETFSGQTIQRVVTHILEGPAFDGALAKDWCILSIKP